MRTSLRKTQSAFLAALVLLCNLAQPTLAQPTLAEPHQLRPKGRTLIEGEAYSAASKDFPYAESCGKCSGQKNLGHFWKNSWFDLHVDVTRSCNFHLSLRAASLEGTKIEVQRVDESGELESLTTIDAPKTEDWSKYVGTQDSTIFLTSGTHRLRFKNLQEEAANIDYVTFSAGEVFVSRPAPSAGPDINPLKGFSSGWWRNEDYASVGFQYIEWGKFEPTDDEFDWEYVEKVLDREGTRGRHFILQFVVDWDGNKPVEANYLGPDWLLKKVGEQRGHEDPEDPRSRPMRATKYNDPIFIDEASEAIAALMDRYQSDARTFVIQVGVLGFWGEWHTYPRIDWSPTEETKSKILNAYLSNLGPDDLTQIRYPKEPVAEPQRQMGYTNGSVTLTKHGKEFGEAIAERGLWKNGPVGGEWPPNVEPKHWESFFLTKAGVSLMKEGHYSTVLPPEPKEIVAKLPDWNQDGLFMQMHRQMGYNFRVKQIRHVRFEKNESPELHIEVDLHNAGIAPFYKNWDVQLAVLDPSSELVELINVETDLRKLGPKETITLGTTSRANLDPRVRYQLGLRILQPRADESKQAAWHLRARNVYIVLANDLKVVPGEWDSNNALRGGWNLLTSFQPASHLDRRPSSKRVFPFEGSFRPHENPPRGQRSGRLIQPSQPN